MLAEITTIDVDAVPDDWESLTSAGIDMRAKQDVQRWALGDLAIRVDKKYGEGSLKKFATDIRMPSHKTLYDYYETSKFFDKFCRAELSEMYRKCSWSHFRAAARAVDLDAARHYLEMADNEDMPVAAMVAAMKADLGNPVTQRRTFEAAWFSALEDTNVLELHIESNEAMHKIQQLRANGATVTVVVTWTDAPQPGA